MESLPQAPMICFILVRSVYLFLCCRGWRGMLRFSMRVLTFRFPAPELHALNSVDPALRIEANLCAPTALPRLSAPRISY